MTYFVQKRKKGSQDWETCSTYEKKGAAIAECRWNALHLVDSEEYKNGLLEWEHRVITETAVELLRYTIKDNKRVKA